MIKALLVLAAFASAKIADAQPSMLGGRQIQSLPYTPNQVVPLSVASGYAILVELSPDERIDNVIVGDSSAWQVTTTKQGNEFVVKPISDSVSTDLIVTTESRRYVFLLKPSDGSEGGPFVLRFDYPEAWMPTTVKNTATVHYHLRGDAALFPTEMSGDGERTSIVWKAGAALPAVFAVDGSGREALVNGRMVGSAYVIEGNSPRYIFRRDKAKAAAIRDRAAGDRR